MRKSLQALSLGDIHKSLNKAGITHTVQATQIVEAVKMFIQSEFSQLPQQEVKPISVKHNVLLIAVQHPSQAQILKDQQGKIQEYVKLTCNYEIERIQFTTQSNSY